MVAAGSRGVPCGRRSTPCARRSSRVAGAELPGDADRFAWQAQRMVQTHSVSWGTGSTSWTFKGAGIPARSPFLPAWDVHGIGARFGPSVTIVARAFMSDAPDWLRAKHKIAIAHAFQSQAHCNQSIQCAPGDFPYVSQFSRPFAGNLRPFCAFGQPNFR